MRKYILIPEYAPLYSMRKCFGPTQGPLSRPTPTPIDIIGELLLQSGKEKLTIYEVVPEGKGFSAPVQLTLTNYKLPYEEIVGKTPSDPNPIFEDVQMTPPTVVEPVIVKDEKVEESAQAPEVPEETPVEEVPETPVVETASESVSEEPVLAEEPVSTEETEPAVEDLTASVKPDETGAEVEVVPASTPITSEDIDWSKLTKAERRRLRKELAADQQPTAGETEPQV